MKNKVSIILLLVVVAVTCTLCACNTHTHEFGEWTTVVQPDCTGAGIQESYCSCGQKQTRSIPAIGHIYTSWTLIVKPTCIRKGQEQGICSCGDIAFRNITETDHTYGMWSIVENATCRQNGQKIRTCDYCGQEQTDTIPATGHQYGNWTVVEQATCTEDGQEKRICQCGVSETRVINAKGHNYVNGKCTVCQGNSSTACTHIASDWIISTDATCTQDGSKHKVCTLCNTKLQVESIPATGHSAGTWVTDRQPTCTQTGSKHQACANCGATIKTESIKATGHSFGAWNVVKKATCAEDGQEKRICQCGVSETRVIEAIGHGFINNQCTLCGEMISNHDFQQTDICKHCNANIADVAVETYNMSATTDDNVKGYVVSRIDGNYDVYIKGAGEMKDYSTSPFYVDGYTLANAYIENGITSIGALAFSNCNNILSITIPVSVIRIGNMAFYSCDSLTSITIEGSSRIGDSAFVGTAYYKNSNNWQNKVLYIDNCLIEAKITIESCTIKDGTKIIADYAFYKCNSLTNITIPSSVLGIGAMAFSGCSDLTSVVFDNTIGWYCTWTELPTSDVKLVLTDPSQNADYLTGAYKLGYYYTTHPGHTFVSITTPATCTERGYTTYTCYCGYEYNGNYINALGHDEINHNAKKATCTEIGWNTYVTCSRCDYTTYQEIPSHTYVDNVCSECGNVYYSEGLEYNLSGTSYIVSGIGTCTDTDIRIPSIYNGKPVTSIGDGAFEFCKKLTNITIPSSVTSIGDNAFCYLSLANITIPSSVTSIGEFAFRYCTNLTDITIPSSVTTIGFGAFDGCTKLSNVIFSNDSKLSSIPSKMFNGCKGLVNITLPSGVTSIGSSAFYECTGLKNISIPEGVTNIANSTFYKCSSLENITIPSTVTSISRGAFKGCTSLVSMTLPFVGANLNEAEDTYFGYIFGASSYSSNSSSVPASLKTVTVTGQSIGDYAFIYCSNITSIAMPNGVYYIGMSAFNCCTSLTSITIPSATFAIINDNAFASCTSLTSITIPSGVVSIGYNAFYKCTGLASIIIPSTVVEIGKSPFHSCTNLTNVTFEDPYGWYITQTHWASSGTSLTLTNSSQNATYLKSTYSSYYWYKD